MNHIYKVIWNTITQTWVAVSELSRAKGKTKSSKTLTAVVLAAVSTGAVVGGAEAAMFAGQGDGISIQSQNRNTKVAKAEGVTAIAIGYDVSSKGTSALAIGTQTHATGEKTVAVGHLATATGSESAAFGVNATAAGNGDIALGKHAVAQGGANGVTGSAALGDEAHATGAQSAAVGGKSSASGTHTIASGYKAGASGENAAAFGADSTASGTNAASIGPSSTASGSNSAALGMQAQAKGAGSLAAGAAAQATKDGSTAVGTWTEATAEKTTALGDSAHATTNRATALGHDSQATGEFSTAAGVSSRASGSASVATGKNATASGANTIAIGNAANAAGTDSIATGRQAATTGSNAIATGADSSAANNASAYGNKAKATGGWSSAFGNESKAAAADASAFGNTATAAAQDSTAIGAHSSVTSVATGGTALGRSSSVTTAGGVALGQGSASTRAALDGKNITISSEGSVVSSNHITDDDSRNNNSNDVYAPVKLINDPNTLTRVKETIKGSAGAVSLGNGTTTRQLTNLAPGSADSDAVNVAQLKAVVGSIKKYNVTSPDGSITITNPTPGQDPQNFQISMNTTAVKDAAAWKIKANKETDDKATSVRGGDIVTFKAKDGGNSGDTIKISRNEKELTFEANYATIRTTGGTEGTVRVDDNVKDNWLAKAKNVAEAINASGWTLQANGQKVGLVNPGDKVNIATDANSGITVTPTNENTGVSTIKLKANVTGLTAGENVTISNNNGNYTINAKDTNTQASVSKAANSPITINATGAANAKNYELDVAVDGTTIVKKDGKLTANVPDVSTTNLTVNNNGKVDAPTTDDGKKLVNATTVANAVNNSYWKATRGTSDNTNDDKAEGDATSNIKAGDELTFVAGKNMALKKAGNTFTYGTKNDVSFNKVTSTEFVVNPNGKFTVGAGSTINMGDNIIHGVKAGVENTDAVNVAQLKANTSVVSAGDNITVTQATNTEGNKVYTVTAKNTQATVSKANGDNPITLDSATTNANGTTNYKVGLAIDDSTLEIKGGKLAAKAQAKAIETVESKAGGDNIAQVNVKSGNAGDAGATYQVNVSKNTVKDAAQEAVTVSDDKKTNVNSPITVTASKDEANHSTDYKVSFDGNEAAKVIPLTYKANGQNAKTVKLSEGLDFTNGKGTKASVGENGKVTFDANVTDITQGDNITVTKDNDGKYTISATDTNTQASVSKAANSPITINATGAANAKNYELDVAVDGTTIVKKDGKLTANVPDVSTTNLTVNNNGKVDAPTTDDGKKLVNATTVANAVNNSYWKATRGTSDNTNDDKAEGDATSNIKAGDELTFVAGKNMALKKAGNTFTYGTKNDVSFNKVTSTEFVVNPNGKFTVGAGSTINMGDNIIHGVKAGVENTDAVNVAQLKANTTTVVAGKNVSVDVAENASTGKTFTVNADKTTVSGTGPVTVKATSDVANHTTNYNVEFDSSKAAEQTDLTYKANGKDAKKVKLSEGLDFTNGKGTKASVGENGKVTIDANVTDIAAGNNIQVNKGDDGKYTISSTNTITTVKGKDGSAAKVTTTTGSTDTNKIYEVDVNVDGKTIVNENGTLQAKGWKTKVVKGEGEVEGASEETVNGSDTVNYIAGKNVKLVQNGKNFTIATKDNVTFKDTTTTNLSVTPGGKIDMGNNKVTNVAEGTENTDAVNVKQLKDFKAEVAEGGLTFAGNSGTAHKAKLNTTVNIKGGEDNTDATKFDNGKNVMTAVDGNTVTVSIKKTPEVEGINITDTTGNVKVKLTQTDEGLKVSDGNNNATRITNVKAGEKDTDAVNVKQLKAAKTEVEAGDNIEITSRTDATNGQTIYKVSAKGINDTSAAVKEGSDHVKVTKSANTHKDGSTTVTDYTVDLSNKTKEDIKKGVDAHTEVTTKGLTFNADKGTTGVKKLGSKVSVNGDGKNITTTADENGVKVSMKDDIKVNSVTAKEVKVGDVNINENGINAGGKRITNVAPGKDGTDAVNVNQLKYVAGNISNQINNVDKGLRAGIAGALASGGLYHVTTAGKSMVSVGAGTYRGQNALAVGYSRLSDNGKVGVKFTVNSNSQGHAGASASVGYQW